MFVNNKFLIKFKKSKHLNMNCLNGWLSLNKILCIWRNKWFIIQYFCFQYDQEVKWRHMMSRRGRITFMENQVSHDCLGYSVRVTRFPFAYI